MAMTQAKIEAELRVAADKRDREIIKQVGAKATAEAAIAEAQRQYGGVCLWCGFSTTKGSLDELADAIHAHLGECGASPVPTLIRERDEARSQLEEVKANALIEEEQLLAVLPEDFGAVEYIKSLESQLREAQSSVLALRELADDLRSYTHDWDWKYGVGWDETLSTASATAQRVRADIEREALDAAWERVRSVMIDPPWRVDQRDVGDEIRDAILGEKGDM